MGILDGKVALVTGAGQGVGRGIALALAAEGARVALVGRTLGKLESVAAEIAARGGESAAFQCDVGDNRQIDACLARVIERFGGVQILINNAQEVTLGRLLEFSDEAYVRGFDTGPLAALRWMRACHPYLRGAGAVVNLATAAGVRHDMSGYGAYASVKEALRTLSRAAACEWGGDGIRVNCIMPLANSPAVAAWMEFAPEDANALFSSVPLKRVGDCEQDIGRVVVFLCGPDSAYITGHTLPIDGGQALLR